jgi:hypothetical protein
MLRTILEGMLGGWGMGLLNFYEAHSLAINLVVVAYGIFLVLSWVNLKNIRRSLIVSMVAQLRSRPELNPDTPIDKELKSLTIPWDSAVSQVRFPFVAKQNDLLPHRLSAEAVRTMLPADRLTKDALFVFNQQQKSAASQ